MVILSVILLIIGVAALVGGFNALETIDTVWGVTVGCLALAIPISYLRSRFRETQ
jgi:hypothetical protein